jgi:hypothetical protein
VQQTLARVAALRLVRSPQAAGGASTLFCGCATDQRPECAAGANAFYEPAQQGRPPTLAFCPAALAGEGGKVVLAEEGSAPALSLEIVALHEMLHAVLSAGAVDVYLGTRLQPLLRDLERPGGGGSLATVNPDSIALFVYQSLASFKGIGGGVDRNELSELLPAETRDPMRGFGSRPARRAARVAMGVAEQWIEAGAHDLESLYQGLFGLNPGTSTWAELEAKERGTAALLAGGEVSSGGGLRCAASHPGFAIGCPEPQNAVTQGDVDQVEEQSRRVKSLLDLLRAPARAEGLARDEPSSRLSSIRPHGGEATVPRTISVRRRGTEPAGFERGEEVDGNRGQDRLTLPQGFSSLPTIGAQVEAILRAIVVEAGGAGVGPLVSFLARNGSRPDLASRATWAQVTGQPPAGGK